MSISAVRTTLKNALATISGLNVYSEFPAVLNLPAAVVTPRPNNPIDYDLTAGGTKYVYHFVIDLMVIKNSIEEAQQNIDTYLEPTGATSIKAVVEAATLGTDAGTLRVYGVTEWGASEYSGIGYLGCRLGVDIWI